MLSQPSKALMPSRAYGILLEQRILTGMAAEKQSALSIMCQSDAYIIAD
jgi:hypothetical protein